MSENSLFTSQAETESFGERLANSQAFADLFRDGMALVEETATYLDGPGRAESKTLERAAALAYATESMRLTTRLMQLASWLLLQRAVNEGELTPENARLEKEKVKFSATPGERGGPGFADLPPRLRDYIAQGDRLFERVQQFDRLERGTVVETAPIAAEGSIGDQLSRLRAAFGKLQG
jgi:regulator of CtrA degradation